MAGSRRRRRVGERDGPSPPNIEHVKAAAGVGQDHPVLIRREGARVRVSKWGVYQLKARASCREHVDSAAHVLRDEQQVGGQCDAHRVAELAGAVAMAAD